MTLNPYFAAWCFGWVLGLAAVGAWALIDIVTGSQTMTNDRALWVALPFAFAMPIVLAVARLAMSRR